MRRFFPGATSFKNSSSVRVENALLALSTTSCQELIATCTDNSWDVIGTSLSLGFPPILHAAFWVMSSLWCGEPSRLSSGHRRRTADRRFHISAQHPRQWLDAEGTVRSHKLPFLCCDSIAGTAGLMTRPVCRATSEYSTRYPRRTPCKGAALRTRCAALPVRCPASERGETEAAAQCRIRRSPRRRAKRIDGGSMMRVRHKLARGGGLTTRGKRVYIHSELAN